MTWTRSASALAICLGGMLVLTPAGAGSLTKEQVSRFDSRGIKSVDPDKAKVYARHLYDKHNILADYDRNLNGRIDPDELEQINVDLAAIDSSSESAEIRLRSEQHVPIPLESSPASIEAAVRENVSRAYLREKRIEIGIDTEKPGDSVANGAAITVTNDIDGHKTVTSISAAAGYMFRHNFALPSDYNPGDLALTAVSFGPYVEANGEVDSATSRVSFGAIAQAELFGGQVFDLQRFSFAPYYQTDFRGDSSIYGAALSWQPYVLDLGLGSIRRLGEDGFDFTWGLSLQGDYRHVADAGGTGLKSHDDYGWVGAAASVKIWPLPELLQSKIFAQVQYSYFHDAIGHGSASVLTAGLGYTIDEAGNASINVEYIKGEDYQTETDKNTIKTALKVKF